MGQARHDTTTRAPHVPASRLLPTFSISPPPTDAYTFTPWMYLRPSRPTDTPPVNTCVGAAQARNHTHSEQRMVNMLSRSADATAIIGAPRLAIVAPLRKKKRLSGGCARNHAIAACSTQHSRVVSSKAGTAGDKQWHGGTHGLNRTLVCVAAHQASTMCTRHEGWGTPCSGRTYSCVYDGG